ncbi:transporter YjgP/YjgQ [Neokomagataea thailandica NBRC 106555]|uniref:YjgP/YjgQ family permease n=2 Tax=Neokomagataea TaxID=1223423 RepID=A0A4Y6V4I2_9PROT|nr:MULTISPECIES: LptF/LptG family permease [Neokomagataea]QDH24254.1 YjgP/YjgQ family permease [Neokomagataea tanensis]GBR52963.1 transporter YjgP/YjgQ [Neokomagataea thailandica NBRC 106555]
MTPKLHTLDRYLLRQMAPPFIVALGAMLVALLLERLLTLFDYLASAGSSLSTCIKLLTDLLPHYFGIALPASLCIAVFLTVRSMSDHNEIDAIRAARISLIRLSRPFMFVGCGIGLASVLLYGYIQPVARYDYRAGFYVAEHTGWAPHLQAGMFASTSSKAMMTADKVRHGGSTLGHIFIREIADNGTIHLITAERGLLTVSQKHHRTELDLWDGQIVDIPLQTSEHSAPHVTHFGHAVRIIERQNHDTNFRSRGADERELTLFELAKDLRYGVHGIEYRTLRAEFDFRMARALAIPFIPPLAVALAIGGKRRRSIWGLLAVSGILVGFDQILMFGHSLASLGKLPIWLAIWTPEALFCAACLATLLRRSRGSWRRRLLHKA